MEWERAIGQERAALMRIATLLCALAALAELAAGRSAAVRGFVVWLLRRAEAVAWDFVVDDPDLPFEALPSIAADGSPAEAMALAASFRAMARELERQASHLLALAGEGRCETQPRSSHAAATLRALAEALALPAAFALATSFTAPDTS